MDGEPAFSALFLEFGESIAGILLLMVRSKMLDLDPLLSVYPSHKEFISVECLILGPERGQLGKA